MSDTNRTHLSLDDEHRARLVALSLETGKPMTTVVEEALDEYGANDCGCNGRGTIAWYAGGWIYCACQVGLDAAMTDLTGQLQIFAKELEAMRDRGDTETFSYRLKEQHHLLLCAQHDQLEREWTKLQADRD
jgi:hypothetical protein